MLYYGYKVRKGKVINMKKKKALRRKVEDAWNQLEELSRLYGAKSEVACDARSYWMGLQVAWDTMYPGEE